MSEQVLTILKLCLLALLYLFFLRVLRAVWNEVQEPAALPVGSRSRRRKAAPRSGAGQRAPVTATGAAVGTGTVAGVAAGTLKRPGRAARSGRAPREVVVVGPDNLAGTTARLDAEVSKPVRDRTRRPPATVFGLRSAAGA